MFRGRTPLGWLQLTHSKTRFAVASAGVGFAVLLVFMQLGFMNMLFDATTIIHQQFRTDPVVMSSEAEGILPDSGSFARRRLIQAAGVPGVADWAEVYMGATSWTRPSDGEVGSIQIFGVPTDVRVFQNDALHGQMEKLRVPGTFLIDLGSRGDFSAFFAEIDAGQEPTAKMAGRTATAVGTFRFGASFGTEAIAIVSRETFLQMSRSTLPGVINMGLIRVDPGLSLDVMDARITDVAMDMIMTTDRIVMVFLLTAAMGVIAGTIAMRRIYTADPAEVF